MVFLEMTRSKVELATILVKLTGILTDEKEIEKEAKKLANELSLMKLCYEIQKVEEMSHSATEEPSVPAEAAPKDTPPPPAADSPVETAVSLTQEEQKVVEELKVPEKTSKEKRNKHILSWLLDSSDDEE
jgi:hypothetical protein